MRKYLEIGATDRISEDWDLMDIQGGDYTHDITKPFPIEDESYEKVYTAHTIEHIPWYEVESFLSEIYRILKPSGCVEIHAPNAEKIILSKNQLNEEFDKYDNNSRWRWMNRRLIAGQWDGRPEFNWHKSVYTYPLLKELVQDAGFKNCEERNIPLGAEKHGGINMGITAIK